MNKKLLAGILAIWVLIQWHGAMALSPKDGYETDPRPAKATRVTPRRTVQPEKIKLLVNNNATFRKKLQARNKKFIKPKLDKEFESEVKPRRQWNPATTSSAGSRNRYMVAYGGTYPAAINAPSLVASSSNLQVTIQGQLFYSDKRDKGRFSWRKETNGNTGEEGGVSLAALDVVADIYEVDTAWCDGNDLITSATVGSDGSYSATFTLSEGCGGAASVELAVRFRLRFCNSETRCIEVVDADGDTYKLWHPDASEDNPLKVSSSRTVELDRVWFQTKEDDPSDDYLQAVNIYASLVDAARAWHKYGDVPFYYDKYGEVSVKYPVADLHAPASTTSAGMIKVRENTDSYVGKSIFHEYGHIIHNRAWEGTTGDCGDCPGGQYNRDGDDTWGATTLEYPNTAFQEGWANFADRATSGTETCDGTFDDNSSTEVMPSGTTTPSDGESYARNVTKVLCDWEDGTNDNDTARSGSGDHFQADSLYSVWYNLHKMWDWASDKEGLKLCDYVKYYLNERKSVANVGQSTHEAYVSTIKDLIYNNGVACGYSAPSGR